MKNLIEEANLLDLFGFTIPLPSHFQSRLNDDILTQDFRRKHYLLRPGEICRRLYFVCSGFIRAYFIDQNGKECTTWFVGKGDLVISANSFFNQLPSHEYIQVLKNCKLQSLTWRQINALYAEFHESNLLGRIFIQKYFINSEERSMFLRIQQPEQRYDKVMSAYPDLALNTTQTNIASYLGMSRETLSRIRRKKLASSSRII